MMTGETILTRVKSITIGTDGTNNFVWTGIRTVKYEDTDPWIHIKVPYGKMLHQEVGSPHIEGEIHCQDLTAMSTALYDTVIDAYNHTAIDDTNVSTVGSIKWRVDYFVLTLAEQNNEDVIVTFTDFRVHKVTVEGIEAGKEATIIIKFSADEIAYS